MATHSSFCLMVLFMASAALLVNTGLSTEAPSTETNSAPRPLSSYELYLNNCATKLSSNCGKEIFSGVFFGNETVSDDCCLKLVNHLGKRCHDDLTKYLLKLPKFKQNEIQILQRSEDVWNGCVSVDFSSPQPSDDEV